MRHGASTVRHGVSTVRHGAASVRHGASSVRHGASSVRHGASTVRHGVSSVRHGASIVRHGALSCEISSSHEILLLCWKFPLLFSQFQASQFLFFDWRVFFLLLMILHGHEKTGMASIPVFSHVYFNCPKALSTASSVVLISSSVCSVVRNQASYLDGARLMPSWSISLKKRPNMSPSVFSACS